MYGRTERELAIEQQIEKKLYGQCSTVRAYYVWLGRKAATTKSKYISYVIQLISFCEERMNIPEFSEENFRDISLDMLNEFFHECSKKKRNGVVIDKNDDSIVATKICAISTFFKYLEMRKIIDQNICVYVDRPRLQDKDCITFLEQSEIRELFANIENGVGSSKAVSTQKKWKNRDKLLCMLPLITGIRISALRDINVADIDLERQTLRVIEKEDKTREFDLPDNVIELIKDWLRDRKKMTETFDCQTDALLIGIYRGQCKRLGATAVNNIIAKYTSTIPKKITAHKLRDTFATNLYRETNDIYLVSELLGHESPDTTKKYVRASKEQKKAAINIMSSFVS